MEQITSPNLNNDQKDTPYNTDFNDFYHSRINGLDEARYVFQEGNSLPQRWKNQQSFTIVETGFGTGLNFLATWQAWQQNPGKCQQLHYISIEKHPFPVRALGNLLNPWPELKSYVDELIQYYPPLLTGIHRINLANGRIKLTLCLMDIQTALNELSIVANCWFLDGFAPAKNPEMWSLEVMFKLAKLSKPGTTLATYTAASQVRRNLQAAGWSVAKRTGFGGKREMLIASLPETSKPPSEYQPWYTSPPPTPLAAERTATVIGGGIAGCQIAHKLAERNWQVCLIERHPNLAQEASGNPAGVVSPKMTAEPGWGERFYRQAFLYVLNQLRQLTDSGKKIEWNSCGSLQLNHNAREHRRWQLLQERGLPDDFIQFPDAAGASALSGIQLNSGGSFFPQAGWLNPQSFCAALVQHPNIEVILETMALKLNYDKQRYQVTTANQTLTDSNIIVIANGRDANRLLAEYHLPLMPVRGQTSTVQANGQSGDLKTVLGHEGYLTPAIAGRHVFGATFERDISDPAITAVANQTNWLQLQKHLPEFTANLATPESAHAAIRMTTPDRYPYIGPLPDAAFYRQAYSDLHHGRRHKNYPAAVYEPGLFVATGFGSRGLTTSALCSELLVSLINGEPLPVEKSLYYQLHPARFLVKQLKQKSI